mmetsp:Transcript_19372/g.18489  ORF Transcript_19372/g.18489 Transcript_19372/m.18489 type:complete len:97 (+) Transcript_19372:128-418(+)
MNVFFGIVCEQPIEVIIPFILVEFYGGFVFVDSLQDLYSLGDRPLQLQSLLFQGYDFYESLNSFLDGKELHFLDQVLLLEFLDLFMKIIFLLLLHL